MVLPAPLGIVLAAGQVGVGAEQVGSVPQTGFDLGDVAECVGGHAVGLFMGPLPALLLP